MLLELLRDRTAALHRRAEVAVDLPARCRSLLAYRDLLIRLLAFYGPLERNLSRFEWSEAGLCFDERRKAHLLAGDLAALELPVEQIETIPESTAIPQPTTLAAAIGCLYVLEGATLGGQVIARKVRDSLGITPANGGSFHSAYDDRIGAMWQSFRGAANRYCDGDAPRIEEALAGAMATFEAFAEWFEAKADTHSEPAIVRTSQV